MVTSETLNLQGVVKLKLHRKQNLIHRRSSSVIIIKNDLWIVDCDYKNLKAFNVLHSQNYIILNLEWS